MVSMAFKLIELVCLSETTIIVTIVQLGYEGHSESS